MDIERFTALADRLMERVPEPVLEGLNGGVCIRRNAHRDKADPRDVYIMGEYVTDPVMGCYVLIYYGSFQAVLAGEPDPVWEAELWETIRHELRHHLETRAGEQDLDREDAAQLYELRKRTPKR
jgi:hypothetical protein